MSATIKDWITMHGNHIPLFDGESKEEAINNFLETKKHEDSKQKQISQNKAEADKRNKQTPPKQLHLPNIKAEEANKTSDVLHLKTKQRYRFKEGTEIRNAYVFCGNGSSKEFRNAKKFFDRYSKTHPETGKIEDWQHCAGMAIITNGKQTLHREVHWVQGKDGKIREAFIKVHENTLEDRK